MSIKPTTDNRLCIDLCELFTYLLLCNLQFTYLCKSTNNLKSCFGPIDNNKNHSCAQSPVINLINHAP